MGKGEEIDSVSKSSSIFFANVNGRQTDMRSTVRIAVFLGLLGLGCGDDGGNGPSGTDPDDDTGGNTFSATIDGSAWRSDANLVQLTGPAAGAPTREGTLIISGYETSSARSLQLILSFIIGPATQPLGVNTASTPGGMGGIVIAPDLWQTPLSGQAGFVTITDRTDKRIAGTFNFTAEALAGATPPMRVVTNGAFDVTIDAGLPPLPTGVGSTSTATLGSTPWNAATIVGIRTGPSVFSVSSATTAYTIVLTTAVPIMTTGPYELGSQIQIQVIEHGTGNGWAAVVGSDTGTFNITHLATDRVIGTFSGDIPAVGVGSALAIVSGTVNAYLAN